MMENKISQYVGALLRDRKFRKKEYKRFISEDEVVFFSSLHGFLDASVALLLVKKAFFYRQLRQMAHSLLGYCDENSVTRELLQAIDRFPCRTRYSYYSALVHCPLTFTQLWCINERTESEGFEEIVQMIFETDLFSANDMRMLLETENYSKYTLKMCVEEAEARFGCTPKTQMARKFL